MRYSKTFSTKIWRLIGTSDLHSVINDGLGEFHETPHVRGTFHILLERRESAQPDWVARLAELISPTNNIDPKQKAVQEEKLAVFSGVIAKAVRITDSGSTIWYAATFGRGYRLINSSCIDETFGTTIASAIGNRQSIRLLQRDSILRPGRKQMIADGIGGPLSLFARFADNATPTEIRLGIKKESLERIFAEAGEDAGSEAKKEPLVSSRLVTGSRSLSIRTKIDLDSLDLLFHKTEAEINRIGDSPWLHLKLGTTPWKREDQEIRGRIMGQALRIYLQQPNSPLISCTDLETLVASDTPDIATITILNGNELLARINTSQIRLHEDIIDQLRKAILLTPAMGASHNSSSGATMQSHNCENSTIAAVDENSNTSPIQIGDQLSFNFHYIDNCESNHDCASHTHIDEQIDNLTFCQHGCLIKHGSSSSQSDLIVVRGGRWTLIKRDQLERLNKKASDYIKFDVTVLSTFNGEVSVEKIEKQIGALASEAWKVRRVAMLKKASRPLRTEKRPHEADINVAIAKFTKGLLLDGAPHLFHQKRNSRMKLEVADVLVRRGTYVMSKYYSSAKGHSDLCSQVRNSINAIVGSKEVREFMLKALKASKREARDEENLEAYINPKTVIICLLGERESLLPEEIMLRTKMDLVDLHEQLSDMEIEVKYVFLNVGKVKKPDEAGWEELPS